MHVWQRWRADLARPELPTGRGERPFLIGAAAVITVVSQVVDPGTPAELLAISPAVVAFALRGHFPQMPAELFAALVLVPITVVVGRTGVLEPMFFLSVLVVLYVSWSLGSLTRALLIAAAGAAMPVLIAEVLVPDHGILWVPWTMANLFLFSLGRSLHRQSVLIAQLERARQALAEQAVAEERRRIARELHDLAGHTLAAMLLHVTGARHVLRRDIAETERALADAEGVGRASLDQIRATVAALRTDERGTDPALQGAADLCGLVADYRRAGLEIDAEIADVLAAVDGAAGVAAHRIVREALANVARHAPANAVELRAGLDGDQVHLMVADHGHPASPPDLDTARFGLVGMTERARGLGGELHAHPTADGWVVEARLPVDPPPSEEVVAP